MATTPVLDMSDEKSNGTKLMRLIVDGGTEALRKTFKRYHPGNLQTVLSTHQSKLSRLKPRFINNDQWKKLYPPSNPPNINEFDITLLSVLLRNICGSSPPALGWDKMPNNSDLSVQADIVRIKLFRNERFGHIPNTSVTLTDFKAFWTEISSALVRLGIDQDEINTLENELSYSDRVLNEHLVSFNFEKEIEICYEKFVEGTRIWVFSQVETWLSDKTSPNHAFIISGDAGMGKTVIAAVICSKFAEHVGASHFFQYNNSQYSNSKFFLQSLAGQLCKLVPEYRKTLVKKLSGNFGQSLNDMNIEGIFAILFKEPFSNIPEPEKPILIVLDAIDEVEFDGRDELGRLISIHLPQLPSYLRFFITARPEKNLIDKFKKFNPLCIKPDDERNIHDVKLVLEQKILSAHGPTLKRLAEKCGGSMLYAFLFSKMYQEESSKLDLDNLPKGIEEYYEYFFKRLDRELRHLNISGDKFLSFLQVMAVAREPLPEAFLETIFGFEKLPNTRQMVRKAVNSISSLFVIKEDKSISFMHKSVRDWLVDNTEHDYSIDMQYGHEKLLGLCVKELVKFKERDVAVDAHCGIAMQYALKYWIPHMLETRVMLGELECFLSDHVSDLEILFFSVRLNVDLTLYNLTSLMNYEVYNNVQGKMRATLSRLSFLIKKFAFLLRNFPETFLQHVVNEGGEELSKQASNLLKTRYKDIICLEFVKKDRDDDALEARCLLSGHISSIDISRDHDFVVCSYRDGGIELFSLATGVSNWKISDFTVELPSLSLPPGYLGGPCMLPHCIVFHPLENLILPGILDQALTLQGVFTTGLFQCDESCSKFTNSCFSSDGSRMVTYHGDKLIVWSIPGGKVEKTLPCKMLFSFSFTASGNFLGAIDVENVLHVYDVGNDYSVRSLQFDSQFPVEIISAFDQNSWICSVHHAIAIVSNSFLLLQCGFVPPSIMKIVLPSNFFYPNELECFLRNENHSWFSKVRKKLNSTFGWSALIALRYILIGDKSVLIYSGNSNTMYVFSKQGLFLMEEPVDNLKGVFSNISLNGDFAYFDNTWKQSFTVCNLALNKKDLKPYPKSSQCHFPVVRDGVILFRDNSMTPELWNSDVSRCLTSFHQLAGTSHCMSVSDELIVCQLKSSVIFFDVFTKEIKSQILIEDLRSVIACSVQYHVLAQIESSDVSLWKNGKRLDEWENVFHKNTSLRCVLFAEFSPSGDKLALFSVEINKIFLFDVISISFLLQIPINGPRNDLLRLSFFNDENLICSSTNHMLYFINIERGEILSALDVGDIPAPIVVCRKQSIIFAGLNCSEHFELINVRLPRAF